MYCASCVRVQGSSANGASTKATHRATVTCIENLLLRISETPTSQTPWEQPDHHNGKGEDDNLSSRDIRPHIRDNNRRARDSCGPGERAKQCASSAHEHREKSGNQKADAHLRVDAHNRCHHRARNARQRSTNCEGGSV